MDNPIVNRVAQSGLITLNPVDFLPAEDTYALIDLKGFLFKEMLLKEKDFRAALKEKDWAAYKGKAVCIYCSNEAIIPQWAPMLLSTYLGGVAQSVHFTKPEAFIERLSINAIADIDESKYQDQRIVIKGCGDKVPQSLYVALVSKLQPLVKSIMYGEPCSTVPVYKKKRNT